MKKLLFIIAVLLSFSVHAQTFTPIHNYQAPDGLDVAKFFGIPYGSTPTLNGVNRPNAHPLYYKTTDSSLYLYSGNQWIRVGGGNGNKDTVLVDEGLGVRFDSLGVQHIFAIHPDGYEGGIVTYTGTGFDFSVSPITLYLNNKVFSFPETTLTLSPPNSLPRYDIFGVDSLGAFVKSGDTSALPIEPQVGVDSFALTKAFLISPGDTVPSNITTIIIYDQNTEWTTGTQGSASVVDFDNTDNPYHLTKDIFISKYNNNSKIYFVNGSYTSIENTYQSVLLLPIYLNSALAASNNIYIKLYDTLTASTNSYRLGSNDNFNKNEINTYQTVVIPTNNFTWVNNKSTFTTLLVTFSGYDTSGANGLYMDYVRLQKGLSQTGSGSCPLCIVDIHVTADSLFQVAIRQNGDTASVIPFGNSSSDTTSLSNRINQKVNISDTASMLTPYQKNITLTTTGSSGAATLTGSTLNIPQYSGGGGSTDTTSLSNRIDDKLAISDTTNKWVQDVLPKDDSTFTVIKNGVSTDIPIKGNGGTPPQHILTKSPLAVYEKMGSDIYDTLGIKQASSTDSGYLSKEDWNRFNDQSDTSLRIITANGFGNVLLPVPANFNKGIRLQNQSDATAEITTQDPPPIVFAGSYYSGGVTHRRFYRIATSILGGFVNLQTSTDSITWTTQTSFGGILLNNASGFSSNASYAGTANFTNSNFLINKDGTANFGQNVVPNTNARLQVSDTLRGFLTARMGTNARMRLGTSVAAGTISGGSGYPTGGVTGFTGGSGTGQVAGFVSTGGVITSMTPNATGIGYRIGDVLTPTASGTGATYTVTKLRGDTSCGLIVYDTTLNKLFTYNCNLHGWVSANGYSNSYSTSASSQTTFTVTIGDLLPDTSYSVSLTPTSSLAADKYYITNKTQTTFDVVYITPLTGTVTFDWIIQQQ